MFKGRRKFGDKRKICKTFHSLATDDEVKRLSDASQFRRSSLIRRWSFYFWLTENRLIERIKENYIARWWHSPYKATRLTQFSAFWNFRPLDGSPCADRLRSANDATSEFELVISVYWVRMNEIHNRFEVKINLSLNFTTFQRRLFKNFNVTRTKHANEFQGNVVQTTFW